MSLSTPLDALSTGQAGQGPPADEERVRRILAEMPDMKILALSIYADDGFMAGMMRAGALGYILKGCDIDELSDAIRRAAGSGKM